MGLYRKLGVLFASGNLPKAHESFEEQHKCNRYCRFFELPTDYDKWPSDGLDDLPHGEPITQGDLTNGSGGGAEVEPDGQVVQQEPVGPNTE